VPSTIPRELEEQRRVIEEVARAEGLDFYETIFEMIDFDTMNQIAAYGGFPTRYPHWRFGMEYERLKKQHAYGLGRIYEMVINNDPSYAYLLTDNALVDQKTVMAHVYAHVDFFKNNVWFSKSNRKMMDQMANHATRVWRHIEREGYERVEQFIDVCLSLENLIDPYLPFMRRQPDAAKKAKTDATHVRHRPRKAWCVSGPSPTWNATSIRLSSSARSVSASCPDSRRKGHFSRRYPTATCSAFCCATPR
jgi:stage V sporulation protein R